MDTMTTVNYASLETAVKAAHREAIVVDRSSLGLLKFRGQTRLDLIHRMSTQAVNGLENGAGTATILTTDIGRIIDRLLLYVASKEVLAVTGENNGGNIARYLMGFVFFNDDFHVEQIGEGKAILGVFGTDARLRLTSALGHELPQGLHHWRALSWAGTEITVHRTDPICGDGYFVICPMARREKLWTGVESGGITPAGEDAYDYLRIESRQPRFGRELTGDYIPLEAGLLDDISFTKGCYIGQEIIARMESRNRIAKKLVRLRAAKPIQCPAPISSAGRKIGTITSAADGPDGTVALGYVKSSALDDNGIEMAAGDIMLTLAAEKTRPSM